MNVPGFSRPLQLNRPELARAQLAPPFLNVSLAYKPRGVDFDLSGRSLSVSPSVSAEDSKYLTGTREHTELGQDGRVQWQHEMNHEEQ